MLVGELNQNSFKLVLAKKKKKEEKEKAPEATEEDSFENR